MADIVIPLPLCYAAIVCGILFGVWLGRRAVTWVNGGTPE